MLVKLCIKIQTMRYLHVLLFSVTLVAQQIQKVDFKSAVGKITLDPDKKEVLGAVLYNFEVLQMVDTIYIDAQNMSFDTVFVNDKQVDYKNSGKKLAIFQNYNLGKNNLSFNYVAHPKQAIYFNNFDNNWQIWTQGQGKYTSNWFPSFDDVNEKLIFNLDITFDKKYEVISNGVLKYKTILNDRKLWQYRMQKPMSSYLLMLAIGKFENKTLKSKSGIPLELFIESEDKLKFEPTYRHSKEIFDFLETEIGVKYPWQIYKQIPVRDFLYAGMENTSATVFAQEFVVDSVAYNDQNYIDVNAHELAHQWFGDMITAKSGKHHWLQEGFATYYTLLAEKKILGNDYFNWKLYKTVEQLQEASKTDTIPILNEKASSLSFYQKGALTLYVLHENIGEVNFRKAVKNYLEKHKFETVETDDFLSEINKVSNFDSKKFKENWLEKSGFEVKEVQDLLNKNDFIKKYIEITQLAGVPFDEKQNKFKEVMKSNVFYPIKEEIISQLREVSFDKKLDLLRLGMQTNDVNVRRAIAQNSQEIPLNFKSEYETFLDDNSFITKEIAMNSLWESFPENRINLLNKTKNTIRFKDATIRILWITLALNTKDYESENKINLYSELLNYASPKFEIETRQNALTNLIYLDGNDCNYFPFLINGLINYKWQFSKFAKEQIRILLKNPSNRVYFEQLLIKIPENENIALSKLLKS